MFKKSFWLNILFACTLTGCATAPVGYSLKNVNKVQQSPFQNSTLFVHRFIDIRTAPPPTKTLVRSLGMGPKIIDHNGVSCYSNYNRNYRTVGGASAAITRMTAKHLVASKLFSRVNYDSRKETATDFILSGSISQLDAFKEVGPSGATWLGTTGFGLIGALATASSDSKYEATTYLSDLVLNDPTGKQIWAGTAKGTIAGSDYADPHGWSVYQKADLSLKAALEDLVSKLSVVDYQPSDL